MLYIHKAIVVFKGARYKEMDLEKLRMKFIQIAASTALFLAFIYFLEIPFPRSVLALLFLFGFVCGIVGFFLTISVMLGNVEEINEEKKKEWEEEQKVKGKE